MKHKRQHVRGEIRAAEIDGKPGVTLKAITPGVVDDYGTVWMADVFDEALAARGPVLCWAHDWGEPLGPMVTYRTGAGGPEIDFVFSDFDDVPMARRAHSQVSDGTIRDCSVGFMRREWRQATDADQERWPGATEVITKADLDEVSLVLRGAVPGAAVLSVRSGAGTIDTEAFLDIAKRKAAGELTDAEAKVALELLEQLGGGEGDEEPPAGGPSAEELAEVEAAAEALDVEALAAIDGVLDRL